MSVTPGYELFCYHSTAIYFINLIRRPNCSVACLINSVFCLIQQFDGIKYSTDIVGVNLLMPQVHGHVLIPQIQSTWTKRLCFRAFLMRTFRNVFYVRVGNPMFTCGIRSAREWSFKETCGETEVGRGLLAPEPGPLLLLLALRHTNQTPTWSSDLRRHYFAETGQFLFLCSLQLWQQLQRCRQTRTRVHFLTYFTSVLRKQFATNDIIRYLGKW